MPLHYASVVHADASGGHCAANLALSYVGTSVASLQKHVIVGTSTSFINQGTVGGRRDTAGWLVLYGTLQDRKSRELAMKHAYPEAMCSSHRPFQDNWIYFDYFLSSRIGWRLLDSVVLESVLNLRLEGSMVTNGGYEAVRRGYEPSERASIIEGLVGSR